MNRRISGEILGVREAAELLGVTDNMLRARVARRLVPFRKWSGRIIFIRSELMEFIRLYRDVRVKRLLKIWRND